MITIYTSAGCVSPELDMKSEMKKARQSGKLCLSASNPDGRQMDLLFKYYDPKILDPEEKWWDTSPLTYIDLSSNSLRMLDMRISVFAKNLSVLNLRDNEISELPSGLFELTELTKLDLSHNLLKEIPRSISKLSNLVDLNLSFNQLEQVDNNLCMLRALQVLQIDQNRLLNLPTDVGLLQSLTSFSCARNSISELPDTFGKLANLKELDLSYNCLNELPRSFKNLLKLTILNLSFNRIVSLENLPKDEGDANAKLQRFMASDNLISTLEGLEDLSDIVHVNLRSNRVTHIDFDLRKLSKLSTLDLSNNSLNDLPYYLGKMDSLQKLIVSDNPFKRFPRNLSVKSTQVIKDFLSNREKTVQSSPKSQSSNEKPEAKPSSAEEDDVDLKPRESFESSHKLYESDHQVDFIGAFRKISTTSIPVENQNSTVIDGEVVSENLVTGLSPLEILDSEIRDLQNLYESLSISRLQKNEVRKKLAMKRAERNRIAASMQ